MVFSTYGRERIAFAIGSDVSNLFISYFAVGRGSGTEIVSVGSLISGTSVFGLTGSPNFATSRKVTFIGDLSSTNASGLILREFGLITSGTSSSGAVWTRNTIPNGGSIVFDGTNELHIEETLEIM